jgi:hypothetical protein
MERDTEKKPEQQSGVYEPPKVMRVTLRPEEAVLGHCKITGSAGPNSGSNGSCGGVVHCPSAGS